jgi:hypothetical protein
MKGLQKLDLSHNDMGDKAVEVIAVELNKANFSLEDLDLSGNALGKFQQSFAKAVPELIKALCHFPMLQSVNLSHNNLRGDQAGNIDKLLNCFVDMISLKKLNLSHNFLGQSYGLQLDRKPPPMCIIADLIIRTLTLKYLDVSSNQMEAKSALAIGFGLSHTMTLKNINVSGNPIGKFGMKLLLQASSHNKDCNFEIRMKDINADKDIEQNPQEFVSSGNFDPENPEGTYVLDLSNYFYQIVLQYLLAGAEKSVERNERAFEIKQCFMGVTFNGKSKWDPPTEKLPNGIINLGEEPSGVLKFSFTLNPLLAKEHQKMINKAKEEGDSKKLEELTKNLNKPQESIELENIVKEPISDNAANYFFQMVVERYEEQDEENMVEYITNLALQHSLWFSQAHEALFLCKYPNQFQRVAPFLISQIMDRHLRFAIGAQVMHNGEEGMLSQMTSLK